MNGMASDLRSDERAIDWGSSIVSCFVVDVKDFVTRFDPVKGICCGLAWHSGDDDFDLGFSSESAIESGFWRSISPACNGFPSAPSAEIHVSAYLRSKQ